MNQVALAIDYPIKHSNRLFAYTTNVPRDNLFRIDGPLLHGSANPLSFVPYQLSKIGRPATAFVGLSFAWNNAARQQAHGARRQTAKRRGHHSLSGDDPAMRSISSLGMNQRVPNLRATISSRSIIRYIRIFVLSSELPKRYSHAARNRTS